MSQPGRSTARTTRHVTIPHLEGESRDNPSQRSPPVHYVNREEGATHWPGDGTQWSEPAPHEGAIGGQPRVN